eukprot:TRINITY_DN36230_c0_g1_i1.p1 TRINITY_DN36230_c0_g1~~TRINITY_DN36230_c0_g1_i1.p1  ORF type:complete len:252 (+),score=40.29 TRINITY_DN36230_c0_g1_i1:34-756(+)
MGEQAARGTHAASQQQSSAPAPNGFGPSVQAWSLDEEEGLRLAHAMSPEGLTCLRRWWRECWEPQIHGGACATASAICALRYLGLCRSWTQQKIWDTILVPHGLITRGVSLENGVKMLKLLAGDAELQVKAVCNLKLEEVEASLQADLARAFTDDCSTCILVNYTRTLCPAGSSGGGHWSPLAGYAEGRVLILDTNSKVHPPHWAPLQDLLRAMCEYNDVTKQARGYVTLRKAGTRSLVS